MPLWVKRAAPLQVVVRAGAGTGWDCESDSLLVLCFLMSKQGPW